MSTFSTLYIHDHANNVCIKSLRSQPPPAPLGPHGDAARDYVCKCLLDDTIAFVVHMFPLLTFAFPPVFLSLLQYAIVQKEGLGLDKAVEEAKSRMSRYNVTVRLSPYVFPCICDILS